MKKSLLVLGLVAMSGEIYAADYTDTARVISSSPIYERVTEPRRECTMETVQVAPRERSMAGAVVGGVAGGLLGSQVGGGSGNTATTGAGAVAGAVIGDRVNNQDSNRSATGGIVGGVAGALLGSQVGGGSGNKVATAVGGIIGAVAGDRVANPDQPQGTTQQVERCRQVETSREVLKGYNVNYRYNGQEFTTQLPYKPGATIRVRVGLNVLTDNSASDSGNYRSEDSSGSDYTDYRKENRRDNRRYRDD